MKPPKEKKTERPKKKAEQSDSLSPTQSYSFRLEFSADRAMPRESFMEICVRKALAIEQLANEDREVRCHVHVIETN